MSTNAPTSQPSKSASQESAPQADPSVPHVTDNAPVVRRRRSVHRPRRSKTKKLSTQDRERKLKRSLELKILLITAPTLLVVVGGILWAISNANPDESMRPKKLISLSHYMLSIGLAIGTIALFVDWAQKLLKTQKEKREKAAENAAKNATRERRRSSHRRHRSR